MIRALNLYAGIGGNRRLWPPDIKVTAVENRPDIAAVYAHYFPDDEIVIGDAHQYLLDHYSRFDFIWSSFPCQTHSRANFWASKTVAKRKKCYPDLALYQEILFLRHWFKGRYTVENVNPYYRPLIEPDKQLGRHLFWANFPITDLVTLNGKIQDGKRAEWSALHGFDLSGFRINSRKDQVYRNCVHPETGLHIFNCFQTNFYATI